MTAAPLGSSELSSHLPGDHLDAHPYVRVDAQHQDLGWVDPKVADVEGLLPLDDERTRIGRGDRDLAFHRPGHTVERQVPTNAVVPAVLLELGGLPPDRREPPSVDAAHHLRVLEP